MAKFETTIIYRMIDVWLKSCLDDFNITEVKNDSSQVILIVYVYWSPTRFPYHMMLMLHNGCHLWSRNCLPFQSTWLQPRFLLGIALFVLLRFKTDYHISIFWSWSVLLRFKADYHISIFTLLVIVLFVLLRFKTDYHISIFWSLVCSSSI